MNDHAFPNHLHDTHGVLYGGLTKREYFAALALQGILAGFDPISQKRDLDPAEAVSEAVACADALIAELSK